MLLSANHFRYDEENCKVFIVLEHQISLISGQSYELHPNSMVIFL